VSRARVNLFAISELEQRRSTLQKPYLEFLRAPAMSAGIYVLPAGTNDLQRPHHEDEMYYVIRGKARFRSEDEDYDVSAGSVIFVAAELEHSFYNITEEIEVLVFFAPAES